MAAGPRQLWEQKVVGRQRSCECQGAGAQRELRGVAWVGLGAWWAPQGCLGSGQEVWPF